MFTNWKRNADRETRLNPLSIDDIDALTIATLHGMGTTPEKFRENTKQDMDVDITDQGEAIMRRNPKLQMPDSHFKLRDAQEQQEIDDIELKIPEFEFDEERAKTAGGLREMERAQGINRALNAYKNTYKDHIMQAFDKHKAFMQSLGNQPMTVQEFMQHPKVPSFTDYYNQAREGTIPGGDYAEAHPFAITHPKEYIDHRDGTGDTLPPPGMEGLFGNNNAPFIPVITGEPMDLAMDVLLKQDYDMDMLLALQDEAYKLAEMNMPYSRDEYPSDEEYEDDLEVQGEYQLMQMLTSPQYQHLRERYKQSFPSMDNNEQFSEQFQEINTGEPMDLAIDVLLKAGQFENAAQRRIYNQINTPEDLGLSLGDVQAIRNMPVKRIETAGIPTFHKPIPLGGKYRGDPLPFEQEILMQGGASILDLPDVKTRGGTFVYPYDISALAPEGRMGPDINMGVGNTVTLGILEKPEWRAGQEQGRSQPEGYQIGGFDKDAYVRLDSGLGIPAVAPRREWVDSAQRISPASYFRNRRGLRPRIGDDLKYYDYKPVYNTLSRFPVTTTDLFHDPITGYRPPNLDFQLDDWGGPKLASEPMDLAMDALLKRELHPGYPENMSIEDMINAGHDYPFNKDKYPDEYLANYPEEHIEEYGEKPFNPTEPGEQPLHVGLSQRDIDAYREQVYRETLERMSAINNSRDNESWAKWVASGAMPPAPQDSPLRLTRQIMVPVKNADENDVDALMDMPDETGATVVQSFAGIPMNEETGFTRSEPMDLAIDALLKREIHPGSLAAYRQMVEDLGDKMPVEQRIAQLLGEGKYLNHPKRFELHPARPTKEYDYHGDVENLEDVPILNEKLEPFKITDDGYPEHRNLSIYDKHNASPKRITYTPEILEREELPTFAGIPMNEKTGFTLSEPMALAIDTLLKDLSPEAKRHKLEYDKKYESSPERVKYREELNRERRRRGIYGSGDHMDVSHTEGGKLTLESEHDNRARHFKDKGTLRPSD